MNSDVCPLESSVVVAESVLWIWALFPTGEDSQQDDHKDYDQVKDESHDDDSVVLLADCWFL